MKNLFDRAKLFFSKDREFRSALYDIMGFCPHNIDLYRTAFAISRKSIVPRNSATNRSTTSASNFSAMPFSKPSSGHIVYRHFPNKREVPHQYSL